MKKIKILLIIFFLNLCLGCSTNSDSNANITTVIPMAPSDLTASLVNGQVVLTWTDNSTNETGFKIDRKADAGSWSTSFSIAANLDIYTDMTITTETDYTYRVYSFNSAGNSLAYSKEFTITVTTLPTVITTEISSITTIGATIGGDIITDGGTAVTSKGVVWSMSATPTIDLPTKTSGGTGTGSFISTIIGLTSNTTYYVRAYATNESGTSYGNEVNFMTLDATGPPVTDIDGNSYPTVIIGSQVWMQENLNVSRYRNGDIIPQVTDPSDWQSLTTGAWCYYNNNTANGPIHGKLYNIYAVTDPRGLAPQGYHVPSASEWGSLMTLLAGTPINNTSFNGLMAGSRLPSGGFDTQLLQGYWWSTTYFDSGALKYGFLNNPNGVLNLFANSGRSGYSVRCVMD